MTNEGMAASHLRQAAIVLQEAEDLFRRQVWNLVVRRCQEAVELALKGLLRSAGVEVPKIHDVSGSLLRNADRLPEAASREIQALVSASRRLREEREISFYGDEESDTEADRLYSKDDAEEAVTLARRVLAICNAARTGC